jgi:hypothetical protein
MKYKDKFIVEKFIGIKWILHSHHKNSEYAIINAEIVINSKKASGVRIKYNGEIEYNYKDLLKLIKENKK